MEDKIQEILNIFASISQKSQFCGSTEEMIDEYSTDRHGNELTREESLELIQTDLVNAYFKLYEQTLKMGDLFEQ